MKRLLDRGLTETASFWTEIRLAYGWVHQAAHLLSNAEGHSGSEVRGRFQELLTQMLHQQPAAGSLAEAVSQFLKVTQSYWPGLFCCYDVPELPRTNNALEQFFGSARYHERRATGRKLASPALVVRGAVRLVAAVATRLGPMSAAQLRPEEPAIWLKLRRALNDRHEARRAQHRFRRDPAAYLAQIEQQLIQPGLPP